MRIKAATEYALGDISKCPDCKSFLDQGIPFDAQHLRVCANCKVIFWPLPMTNEPITAGYVKALLAEVNDHAPIFVQGAHYRDLRRLKIKIASAMKFQPGVLYYNDYGNAINEDEYYHYDGHKKVLDNLIRIEPVVIIDHE